MAGEAFKVPLRTDVVLKVNEVGVEKNLLIFVETNGRVTAVSKDLVDWYRTRTVFPALYNMYCPESAKKRVQERLKGEQHQRKVAIQQKRNIVLTNSAIKKMKPYKYQPLFADVKTKLKGKPNPTSKKSLPKSDKRVIIKTISHGSPVTLKQHMEPGRFVIFDFYADWCGPCRRMAPLIEQLVHQYPGHVALKKIDIVNWSTPVTAQHGIRSIPHIVLFSPDGNQVGGVGARNVEAYLRGKAQDEQW